MLPPHRRHYLAAFMADLAMSCAFHVGPFYIFDHLDGGAGLSGLIGGLQAGGYAAILLLSARFLSRAHDGLHVALFGAAGFALFWAAAPWIQSAWFFGLCTVVGTTAMALFWASMQSYLGNEPNPRIRSRRIAWYNISWCLGLAVGPPIAARLYEVDPLWPFFLIALASGTTIALVLSLPKPVVAAPLPEGELATPPDTDAATSRLHLHYTWAASATGALLLGVMRNVFPKRMEELSAADALSWLLEPPGHIAIAAVTLLAWISAILYLIRIPISFAMGAAHFWQYRFWFLAVLQLIAAAAFYGLGATHSIAIMLLCCCVVGTTSAATFFASLSYSIADSHHKHRNASIHESMVGIGALVGSLSFGYLADQYGVAWPFLHTPELIVVLVLFQFVLYRQSLRRLRNENNAAALARPL